jgi:hypothetical protein
MRMNRRSSCHPPGWFGEPKGRIQNVLKLRSGGAPGLNLLNDLSPEEAAQWLMRFKGLA